MATPPGAYLVDRLGRLIKICDSEAQDDDCCAVRSPPEKHSRVEALLSRVRFRLRRPADSLSVKRYAALIDQELRHLSVVVLDEG
jgi:hypothetical protein